jgi:spermidine synthase
MVRDLAHENHFTRGVVEGEMHYRWAALVRVTPLGDPRDRLSLRERGEVVEVILGNVVLLSSAALDTERGFGALASQLVKHPLRHVLVGGLGFGATLRGVLDVLPAGGRVTVAEKLRPIIELARGTLAHLSEDACADPRVEIVEEDVSRVIDASTSLDAILLDVDNGPDWASFRENARLYGPEALRVAREALVPGGAFAVWSGYPADRFVSVLRAAGLSPSVVPLKERGVVRARAYVGVR